MANNLHITYDLMSQGQSYDAVIAKIKELGNWAKINQSVWYVNSNYSATQAKDHIRVAMDGNDKLYVVDSVNNAAAWYGISDEVATFIFDKWSK